MSIDADLQARITKQIRERIQAQTLFHFVGQEVPMHYAARFRKAGTLGESLPDNGDELLLEVLQSPNHPKRVDLPVGPLIAYEDGPRRRAVVEVSDLLFSPRSDMRKAVTQYFEQMQGNKPRVSENSRFLLSQYTSSLNENDESKWLSAAIEIWECLANDFRLLSAGLSQTIALRNEELFQDFLMKVLVPKPECFDHDRPPIWNPKVEAQQLTDCFERFSLCNTLSDALNEYVSYCGYLPLSEKFSASRLVKAWQTKHRDADICKGLWNWHQTSKTVLSAYHLSEVFLRCPEYVESNDISRLSDTIQHVLLSAETPPLHESSVNWHRRILLLAHYQRLFDSYSAGLQGDVLATTACWVAEQVAQILDTVNEVLPLEHLDHFLSVTSLRHSISRSRISTSRLRMANLYAPSIWSDSLFSIALRHIQSLPENKDITKLLDFILKKLSQGILGGNITVSYGPEPVYAFEEPLAPSDEWLESLLGLCSQFDDLKLTSDTIRFRAAIESDESLKETLSTLGNAPVGLSTFICRNLLCLPVEDKNVSPTIRLFLSDEAWRSSIFTKLPISDLKSFGIFLIDWQLRQEDDWLSRTAHVFSESCINAIDDTRREMLLHFTLISSLAADITSPVVKTLASPSRHKIKKMVREYSMSIQSIGNACPPWVSSRVRRLLGTVDRFL